MLQVTVPAIHGRSVLSLLFPDPSAVASGGSTESFNHTKLWRIRVTAGSWLSLFTITNFVHLTWRKRKQRFQGKSELAAEFFCDVMLACDRARRSTSYRARLHKIDCSRVNLQHDTLTPEQAFISPPISAVKCRFELGRELRPIPKAKNMRTEINCWTSVRFSTGYGPIPVFAASACAPTGSGCLALLTYPRCQPE